MITIKNTFGRELKSELSKKETKELTLDEKYLIKQFINMKMGGTLNSVIINISRKHHLDFYGWDKEEYNDVVICKN